MSEDLLPCDALVIAPEPAGRKPAKKPAEDESAKKRPAAAPKKRPAAAPADSESPGSAADSADDPGLSAAGDPGLSAAEKESMAKRPAASDQPVRKAASAKSLSCPEGRRVYSKMYHQVRAHHKLGTDKSPDEIKAEARLAGQKAVRAWLEGN